MKRAFIVCMLLSGLAWAGALYRFRDGTSMAAAQVNANLKHIHDNMVGQHGARLVDGDVSADAGISHSKLRNQEKVPVAWGFFGGCTTTAAGTDCTVQNAQGLSNAEAAPGAGGANGYYTVWFSSARPNANYAVIVGKVDLANTTCYAQAKATTYFDLNCQNVVGFVDGEFSVVVMDSP